MRNLRLIYLYVKGAYALILILGLLAFPAQATDDPFEFDGGSWTSYENFKEKTGTAPPPPNQEKEIDPEKAATFSPESTPAPGPASKALAFPGTIFSTPAMPGLDKGFDIKVESTQKEIESIQSVAKLNASPDFQLPDKNWETPAKKSILKEQDEDEAPLNVRMTFLPAQNIIPVPSPELESARKLGHEVQRRSLAQKRQKATETTPEVAAACEALDLYKKQQLNALQSDRETLSALQNAIHSLGLSKQFGYITEEQNPAVTQTFAQPAQ